MQNTMFIISIIIGVVAIVFFGVALSRQRDSERRLQSQREAWERAQEVRQQRWHTQQERHHSDLEKYFASKFQDVQGEWQQWEQKAAAQTVAFQQQLTTLVNQIQLEHQLARIPRIEDIPISQTTGVLADQSQPLHSPLHLAGADLSRRDFSSRYLSRADLRGAKLVNARLYMVDLSWACLAGADLSGADLSAANLTHADLRGANLSGVTLLVADMHNAVVIGANLLNTRSLTPEQVCTTIYDGTTSFDEHISAAASSMLPLQRSHSRSLSTSLPAVTQLADVPTEPTKLVRPSRFQEPQATTLVPSSELPRLDVPPAVVSLAESIPVSPLSSPANVLETPLPEDEMTIVVAPATSVSSTPLPVEEEATIVAPLTSVSSTPLPVDDEMTIVVPLLINTSEAVLPEKEETSVVAPVAAVLETPLPEDEMTIVVAPVAAVLEMPLPEDEMTIVVAPATDVSETALPEEATTTTASQDELETASSEASEEIDVNSSHETS